MDYGFCPRCGVKRPDAFQCAASADSISRTRPNQMHTSPCRHRGRRGRKGSTFGRLGTDGRWLNGRGMHSPSGASALSAD